MTESSKTFLRILHDPTLGGFMGSQNKTILSLLKSVNKLEISMERGKAGGYKPLYFPLPCHILAFLSSDSREPQPYGLPCRTALESSGSYYVFKSSTLKL